MIYKRRYGAETGKIAKAKTGKPLETSIKNQEIARPATETKKSLPADRKTNPETRFGTLSRATWALLGTQGRK